jgi:hypothetical protein
MPVIGFYVFNWWLSNQKTDPYNLIPANAFAVIHTHNFYGTWDSLQSSYLWKNLQNVPKLAQTDHKMRSLDSLFLGKKNTEVFFKDKKILISLHLTNSGEFDYLFYIPINSDPDGEMLTDLLKRISSDTSYQLEERTYEGLSIQEVTKKSDKFSFSFVKYKGVLIGSYTAVLVEDVIRLIKGETGNGFLKENQQVKKQPHADSETFIYFNYKNLSGLASIFSDSSEIFKPLNSFASHSTLDIKIRKKDILLSGFSGAGEKDFLNVFKGQKPQKFNLKSYIPNNTSSFYYFGFDNGGTLNESLMKYWTKSDSSVTEERKDVYQLYSIDIGRLFDEFQNEIGLSILEPDQSGKAPGKLLFIRAGNPSRFFLQLNKIVTLAKEDRTDTLLNEKYHEYHIREMNLPEFPHMLLGDFFKGFEKCYYVAINECMVLSNDPRHIRQLLDNIDTENVWSKTAVINNMIENNFSSSNFTLFIDTEKAWKSMMHLASSDIKMQLQNNAEELKQIHQIVLQYNVLNDKIFTNFIINHNLDKEVRKSDIAYMSENQLSMERGILSDPFLFSSKGQNKIIVQDSAFRIYSVSEGITVWSDTLGKAITGSVVSVDMEKKGESVYFGIAQNIIFAYGMNGSVLNGFPVVLPDSVTLNTIAVFDFDHSRSYKIMVSDLSGNLYMFDAKGKPMEEWKAPSLGGKLTCPVKHLRIKGKDILIALEEKGKLWALNKKGEFYKGFPLDLKVPISNPVFLERDESSAENSYITVLSDKGEIIKLNLNGAILKREKVSNLSAGASFKLCLNQEENSYTIVTQSKNELSVLNAQLEEQFEMVLNAVNMDLKYYTNSDRALLAIFDRDANLCYLLNDKGINIFKSAVKATKPLKIAFNGKDVIVIKANQYLLEEGVIK